MINILDLDENTLLSEFKLSDWDKEFEQRFNMPLIQAQQTQQAMQQRQPMTPQGATNGQRVKVH